ncbi:hematopoietic cell signal transducer isoform X2 [Pteropus medius]|uniref:hematopoietic cell signal transducer isoform X2 n=1 Tax=Pteropus vampyrus TaxID=132908 RepID=UPI00196A8F83|nr:hematopoietic cell signal transducer isoform X2 [Pteropus giganteus]
MGGADFERRTPECRGRGSWGVFVPFVTTAQTIPASCSGCGPLSLPLLAGLVATDAVVSLLIVAVVFVCARPRSRPTQEDGKIYINMPGRG